MLRSRPAQATGLAVAALLAAAGCRHNAPPPARAAGPPPAAPSAPASAPAASERSPASMPAPPVTVTYAPDVPARLARFAPTRLDFDDAALDAGQRKLLVKLVAAAKVIHDIFEDQVSPRVKPLRRQLVAARVPKPVLAYYDLMVGPWDRLDHDRPFVGKEPKPLGAGFYPPDLTREAFEAWVRAHPADEEAFRGYFTVIRRQGERLVAVPYSEAYRARLARAATLLEEAAALAAHPALRRYLQARARAFRTNDYLESDMAWMDLGDSPIDVVIGPYEVYEDRLMGYKAAFEAYITLRDPVYSARLQRLASYIDQLEENLPLARRLLTKRGKASPISVVDQVYNAGDAAAGIQTAAFNLPNDERVRRKKGSKKVMLRNVTRAKFERVLVPIAKRVVAPELLGDIDFDAYFTDILLHEVAHGLGPGTIRVGGKTTDVNRALRETYTPIEECKADIVGLISGEWLIRERVLPETLARRIPPTYVAGVFRAVRFGTQEAHARAVLIGFNFLVERGAITRDAKSGRYGVDRGRFFKAARALARKLLLIQARGDYAGAKALLDRYGKPSPGLLAALKTLGDIPVDIRPIHAIEEKMKGW